jgi:hypothetical protein
VSQDINVLALVKGEERYIFLFDDDRRADALRTLGKFASNPELSFSWYDAAVLSQRIRSTVPEDEARKPSIADPQHRPSSAVIPAPHRPRFRYPLAQDNSAQDSANEEA